MLTRTEGWGWGGPSLQVEDSKGRIERRTGCRHVELELPGGVTPAVNEWTGESGSIPEMYVVVFTGACRPGESGVNARTPYFL